MTRRQVLLIVEGPHDEAFAAAILRRQAKLSPITQLEELEPFWRPLVPKSFPHKGELRTRVPVPQFYVGDQLSLAIQVAGGDSKLAEFAKDSLQALDREQGGLDAVGFVLDSDKKVSPTDRFRRLQAQLAELRDEFPAVPSSPGVVATGTPACGVFVLPDNQSPGTLEDLLAQCASISYRVAFDNARGYIGAVNRNDFDKSDLKDFDAPAGKRKAEVAALAAILKPGKTIQVSIQDNRWVTEETLQLPHVRAFDEFLMAIAFGPDQESRPSLAT
jgi:hypothetical protein